ncbi:hypothetical protein MLD38_028181 [Melastoma candidum]|uniref:Uncharacterized protein n=1 Tax=Melastoma candidum TaxID=119954 RepID=A0ACB9N6A5_9MYRT|nr:hypothetical protein MLD38_028181 [Melastoma candidum]
MQRQPQRRTVGDAEEVLLSLQFTSLQKDRSCSIRCRMKRALDLDTGLSKIDMTLIIVIIGASVKLARSKIFPTLFALFYEDHLPIQSIVKIISRDAGMVLLRFGNRRRTRMEEGLIGRKSAESFHSIEACRAQAVTEQGRRLLTELSN